ncbi:hypothetical protein BC941DRAFT_62911 [Chlamydoabsidia padenii]|nr:hypothetical protein BC941DRAFT_62911 [Chlamydoabsidia padenii]
MSNNKTTKQTTYKDLSCLRCRKKKAKCSKTRPSCLRCERSNHPCEYPDAPPNLTDLSKKVLDLYDSLRDLEGELLFKYLQPTSSQQLSHYSDQDEPLDECNLEILDTNSSSPIETVTVNLTIPQQTTQQQLESLSPIALDLEKSCSPQPACAQQQQQGQLEEIDWSMSYLSDGLW